MSEIYAVIDTSYTGNGDAVIAVYSSRQTAQQHADREGLDVRTLSVLTAVRPY